MPHERGRAERIQKILARAGLGSRRACEDLIRRGDVLVDGRAASIGESADPARQAIVVDGRRVRPGEIVHYAVYKPRGVLSTLEKGGRPGVADLVPGDVRVYPVGRLEAESEGLMILTNDGALAHRLCHPRWGVERVYRAELEGRVSDEAVERLSHGVRLAEGRTLPAKVKKVRGGLEIVLREGLNREVRRMLAATGLRAGRIVRVRIASLALGDLAPGEWRRLEAREVAGLRRAVEGPGEARPSWLGRKRRRTGGGPPCRPTSVQSRRSGPAGKAQGPGAAGGRPSPHPFPNGRGSEGEGVGRATGPRETPGLHHGGRAVRGGRR